MEVASHAQRSGLVERAGLQPHARNTLMGAAASTLSSDAAAASGDDVKAALAALPTDVRHKLTIAAVESAGANPEVLEKSANGESCVFFFLRANKLRQSTEEKFLSLQEIRRLHPDWLVQREDMRPLREACFAPFWCPHRWETKSIRTRRASSSPC